MFYLLGAFLVFAGFKLLFNKEEEVNPEESRGVKLLKRFMPVSQDGDEDHFFVKRKVSSGRWVYAATPLFVALVVVEITDVIFALDSIPAILAITVDPFIVYTSNFFAILGLRSLYFVLAHVTKLFSYMHYGVALILIFIGIKMIIKDVVEIPVAVALGVIVLLLGATGLYSTRSN